MSPDPRVERDMLLSLVRLALLDLDRVQAFDNWSEIRLQVATANLRRAIGEEPARETV